MTYLLATRYADGSELNLSDQITIPGSLWETLSSGSSGNPPRAADNSSGDCAGGSSMRSAVPSSMRGAGGPPFSTAGSCHRRLPGEALALADAAQLLRDVLSRDPSSAAAGVSLPPLPFCFRSIGDYADLFRRCVVEETAEVVREDAQKSASRQPWAGAERSRHPYGRHRASC